MRRLSELSEAELRQEIEELQKGMEQQRPGSSEYEVMRQKWLMARSYSIRHTSFLPGDYRVEGEERIFKLKYVNGVMAWGVWEDGAEAAVPIAVLQSM